MGEHVIDQVNTRAQRAAFIRHLLNDIRALEIMLEEGMIEQGITRIGAEQEFCLIDEHWRPSKNADLILQDLDDPHFTTELARYNLEINMDPMVLTGSCFRQAHDELHRLLAKAAQVAKSHNNRILLTGILPTITKNELEFEYITPNPRYLSLNQIMRKLRGTDFSMYIQGVDQLSIIHESVLFEACNTSFQIHLQIDPDDFVASYNWAQTIAGPVLGVSTNSPLLLGRELWSETRIALFQQSVDTRSSSYSLKDQLPRVTFGDQWAEHSIVDVFKNDIACHQVILGRQIKQNALEILEQGLIPKLQALTLHNGTIYRWNRPCYGSCDGKAHIRIENRYIPSGPTITDQFANCAFWVGLMLGRPSKYDHLSAHMDFRDVKANFIKAARTGKETVVTWMGREIHLADLVLKELLPIAYAGLKNAGIPREDADFYLGIIEQRTLGLTGAQWIVKNYRRARQVMKKDDALVALTKAMYENQQTDRPVHEWPELDPSAKHIHDAASLVEHVMSTQLFIAHESDPADLTMSIMQWKNIHHVPVEDDAHQICGLLTWTHMTRHKRADKDERLVADIMTHDVLTTTPTTPIREAIRIMKHHEYGCLPVIDKNQELVGIITIKDLLTYDQLPNGE